MRLYTFLIALCATNCNAFTVRSDLSRSSSQRHRATAKNDVEPGISAAAVESNDRDGIIRRRAFLRTSSVGAAAGVLAWTGYGFPFHAEADVSRPAARGLAEASIQLLGTDKKPIEVSVLYPKQWTVTKTPGKQISIQDYKYTDRAFSLSTPFPTGKKSLGDLSVSFYTDLLFDLNGPYGNFGKVEDFKVIDSKTVDKGKRVYRYVDLKFAAPTQTVMQVQRRVCIASTIVGNDVVIFTASVLASRWDKISAVVAEMVESYRAEEPQKTPDPSSFFFNRT
ncbi:unnamed protein product [Ascophyllum nodosum]